MTGRRRVNLEERLSRWRMAAYAAPTLPLAIVMFPAYAVLPTFYARHTHIPLSTIGVILIVSRAFDAIIDPAIGYLSDRTRSRWGARKPWLIAGALLSFVAVYRLYAPAPTVGAAYYAGWFIAFYLGFTLIEIPHKAWGTDIVRSYVDRTAVSTFLGLSFAIGNLIFALVPFLPGFRGRGYDAEALRTVAFIVMAALPLAIGCAAWLAPQGQPVSSQRPRLASMVRSVFTNKPFLTFLVVFVLAGFGQGIFYGLVFMFIGTVQNLARSFPLFLLADAVATFVAVPIWFRLIARFEKHRAWAAGMVVSAAAIGAMALAPPGSAGMWPLLALVALRALGGAVIYVAPNALLGDVVDYDILRTRTNPAANYHAMMALVTKANGAAGSGVGLILLGLMGFSASGANTAAAVGGFKLIVLLTPALLLAGSGVAAWLFPLDRRRHDIVRRRILSRDAEALP